MKGKKLKMNNKALVVGGNSGIGLSVVCQLIKKGYKHIYIVGKDEPEILAIDKSLKNEFEQKTSFAKINLISDDLSIFNSINDINTLVITAGFGRVALLEELKEEEVNNLLKVNMDSCIRILRHYYNKIHSKENFYTAVMVSIAGRIVSPFFSVYGATKAGLRYFIENVNCELSANGYSNRILDVSPGSLKGTNFSGQGTMLSLVEDITSELLDKMFHKETLYIPQYNEIYKSVIERYEKNSEKYGRESYDYKVRSGRISIKPQLIIGYLSGTFDLFHIGHLNLLRRAKEQCDYLIVSVHVSGAWKGKQTFIPYEERKSIVGSIKYVDKVVEDFNEDCDAWDKYHCNKLFVGSDYKGTERFNKYEEILKGKAEIVYFPYTKGTCSTQLRDALTKK